MKGDGYQEKLSHESKDEQEIDFNLERGINYAIKQNTLKIAIGFINVVYLKEKN